MNCLCLAISITVSVCYEPDSLDSSVGSKDELPVPSYYNYLPDMNLIVWIVLWAVEGELLGADGEADAGLALIVPAHPHQADDLLRAARATRLLLVKSPLTAAGHVSFADSRCFG